VDGSFVDLPKYKFAEIVCLGVVSVVSFRCECEMPSHCFPKNFGQKALATSCVQSLRPLVAVLSYFVDQIYSQFAVPV
jgi:hypothetical protein